jgi:catalase
MATGRHGKSKGGTPARGASSGKSGKGKAGRTADPRGGGKAASRRRTRAGDRAGDEAGLTTGPGGETHQQSSSGEALTTNQGLPLAENQNSLRAGPRGPGLLEDFILREKITHFDHERIPERIVHARGSGAHGHFRPYRSWSKLTRAAFLQDPDVETRTFVRFSTVVGSKGSKDTARDVRGFATKFYTSEGVYDLVGNNMPVFFIQDAMKFPDLVHAVKPEPDRGFPQAASAHDTFWDFVSLMPESMHMLCWAMSDRAIPRSFRMMEGFGVHTFRMVNARGDATFVKFHWRPVIGSSSLLWDEAVKISGADPDFHRRDLWMSIKSGDLPEFELGVQAFTQAEAEAFDFDVLDATKLLPEEVVPVQMLGRMVLDRNPDNVFAETEQVAFCPSHLVPGIEFSNDPLLQGRLFSYLDTQLKRLGGANFHQLPINASEAPVANFQRDGHMRMAVPKGRVAYEPSALDAAGPRESAAGFTSFPDPDAGPKLRLRPESFADHYTQARLFFQSQTPAEQRHIVGAFAFELGKVEAVPIRRRMLGHLQLIDAALGKDVAELLGMQGEAEALRPAVKPRTMPPSPALSLAGRPPGTLQGRKLGVLVTDGVDKRLLGALTAAAEKAGAAVEVIAPRIGGVTAADGSQVAADGFLRGSPSVLFDVVALLPAEDGALALLREPAAVDWVRDAWAHLKVIGHTREAAPLLEAARVPGAADGLVELGNREAIAGFVETAKRLRIWDRELALDPPPRT